MTKDFQQELLEKVRPGTKPSDIKKQAHKQAKTLPSPSPIEIKDDGYESDKSDKIPAAPPLPNQDLLNQITSLQKQLQLYKDFRESDMKIKEKLQEERQSLRLALQSKDNEITNLKQTIETLKNSTNPTENVQPQQTKPKLYFFTCDICEQNKKSQLHLGKVNGLGINPLKENKICDT